MVFEWHSRFKASQVLVEYNESSRGPSNSRMTENLEKVSELIHKAIAKQPVNSQTPLRSFMEFARRL
jgi:hypothetical protein